MKLRIVLPAVIVLSLAAFAFAQEPADDNKPKDEPKPEVNRDAAPARPQDEAKPNDAAKPPKAEQQDAKPEANKGEDRKPNAPVNGEARPATQENGNMQGQGHAHPAGKSAHIPDDKFHANFGRQHSFKVTRTVVVSGQPQFQYSGYTFVLVDPWPAGWAYTDNCYIDYIDGQYVLIDLLHPGVQIALLVVM